MPSPRTVAALLTVCWLVFAAYCLLALAQPLLAVFSGLVLAAGFGAWWVLRNVAADD